MLGGLAMIVGLPLLVGALMGYTWYDFVHLGQARNVIDDHGVFVDVPPPRGPAERLLPEVPVTTTGEYGFLTVSEGVPVRFDPCRPIPWVISTVDMPELAAPLVHDAVARVQEASGLLFEFRGETLEVADFDRPLFQEQYGDGYAPLIIGWSTAAATPDLEGTVSGIGGSRAVPGAYGSQQFLRSGTIVIDGEDVRRSMASSAGQAHVTAIVMHELAHVLGLAHVSDPKELMFDTYSAQTAFGPGDLAGLAVAGAGPCE